MKQAETAAERSLRRVEKELLALCRHPHFAEGAYVALEKWKQLKRISMEVLAEQGATVTHHHAVGRDHRFGY